MKLGEVKELRSKNAEELRSMQDSLSKEFFDARIKHGVGQLENTSRLRELRRDMARVKTYLRKAELAKARG
jgi:large subunit ribosomal protein L29